MSVPEIEGPIDNVSDFDRNVRSMLLSDELAVAAAALL